MPNKRFRIRNDFDGNDFFDVEADGVEEAALAALNELGWYVSDEIDEEEWSEFENESDSDE